MDSNVSSSSKQRKQLTLQQSFSNIQTQCSDLLNNVSKTLNPLFNHNSSPHHHPNNIFSALDSLRTQAKQALDSGFSRFASGNAPPLWARISDDGGKTHVAAVAPVRRSSGPGLSADDMEERLAGVPVYALSNSNEEFVLVSGTATGKSLGLLFCKEEDAEALLNQMKAMDPRMRKEGSKVVALALSKVFQLKVNGVAFRLIPESTQVKNALKERKTAGFTDDDFNGVPVFQSKSLILRSDNKSYRPVFFRKEDLEKSLTRASRQQNRLNPALKPGDIQVAVFEEIVKGMKENATSNWDDIVFIPPGFEVSTEETKD
ncbi:hypothetical protein Bca4012_089850 [Brassica carinata]|uniref:Protein TIC 22-like, chloroplastic n=2 Tax=Brassica TaxID=3705 RepID=A0A0D3AB32_BRAOL|nr:PREDICTED: protein TIC 22-like, chloroplastic isoform X2 [Brassica oleracea var. oleracea]XP_013652644.1 protein TIC 22-like, chloroplastic [Brassica napus]CAF2076438.1 unnamed protein product [Brassica napus]CDY66637.1 BnaCnng51730D [Brassica napus]